MNHQARKRFGQNFLIDYSVIERIIGSVAASPGQHWVEIGPGLGALTEPLLSQGVRLEVIELDRDLVKFLTNKFDVEKNFTIHSADALNVDFFELAGQDGSLHIIGNLPYNISTPLLFHLLQFAHCIEDMHFMLQKEVVDRICAVPGSKKYGRLSIMTQYYCQAEKLFEVPPESFDPQPKVTSAIIFLLPHKTPPVDIISQTDFETVVTRAFSQRRKTLRNSLRDLVAEEDYADLGMDPSSRAETISLESFARISNLVSTKGQCMG